MFLVVRFGLKATPAYNSTACIHRNSESDNCTVSRTIFKISAPIADFLFLNKCLFSPIFEVLKMAIFAKLSDFLRKSQENKVFYPFKSQSDGN